MTKSFINKFKQHQVLAVNILFTFFCFMFPLASGIQFAWYAMWILVPLFMPSDKAFSILIYMSIYMQVINSVKIFSILICLGFCILLIKRLLYLNKCKQLVEHFKILGFYFILIALPIAYALLFNKHLGFSVVYYFNMLNLLVICYLLHDTLKPDIVLMYAYGVIVSCVLSLLCFVAGFIPFPQHYGRFLAFMPVCNTLGINCVILIIMLYMMYVQKHISGKKAIALICVLSLIGVTTLSKSFFISFSISMLFIAVREYKASKNKKHLIKMSLIVIALISPLIIYYAKIMFNRFFAFGSYPNIIDIITTGRLDKWLIYLRPWHTSLRAVLFGLGLGFNYNTVYSSHSFYVGYISKLGIVGFVALVYFIWLIIKNNTRYNFKLKLFPVLIILLICFVEDFSYNTFNFIPFALSLCLQIKPLDY